MKYRAFMTSNVIKYLRCFYISILIKAANYFLWPIATNVSFDSSWDQKASSETEIKRIYLQLVESASFMIYKLLISNQSLILLLVHLRVHTVLIILHLDMEMGIVSYFLFIGYNINLHTCMNACAHTHTVHLWKSNVRLCNHWEYLVHKVNTSSVHYFWKVFFNRTGSRISVNLQLIVVRFCCFQMTKNVLRDALLMVGVGGIRFFPPWKYWDASIYFKGKPKNCKKGVSWYSESCIQ